MSEKVVLITGGSSGLGKEVARLFAKDTKVVIVSHIPEEVEEASQELDCAGLVCDVTDSSQVQKTVDIVVEELGGVDVLINSAGVWLGGELDENKYEDISRVISVNTIGTINMTRAVLPVMRKQDQAKILNVISIDGVIFKKERSVYCASKWALAGFTQCLREDLAGTGISVMGFYPAIIKTGLFEKAGVKRDMSQAMEVGDVAKVIEFMLTFRDNIVFDNITLRDISYGNF
ncbi:SDR family oxidoreductase [bacterium]|nr:SDR family oxidoreductase [bacterium]